MDRIFLHTMMLAIMLVLSGGLTACADAADVKSSEDAVGIVTSAYVGSTDTASEVPAAAENVDTNALKISAAVDSSSDVQEQRAADTYEYNTEEMNIKRDETNLYGQLYRPEGITDPSLVILSHGFGGSHRDLEDYAETFAENGIAAFTFDFAGGGMGSRSDGSMTDMSVLTEAADLEAVLDYFQSYSGIDREHIFLLGASQGGFVSTYVAGERPDDVAGLVLLYPAFVLQDDSRERNPDPESGPDTSNLMGMTIGRIYDIDAQSFDIYDSMADYPGKTLIIHGTADSIVPISYSQRAAETFPDAQLITLEGAGHGFYGSAEQTSAENALAFIREIIDGTDSGPDTLSREVREENTDGESNTMNMMIGDIPVQITWEDNESVRALANLVKDHALTIQMSMYGGFEQVGPIGSDLPRDDVQTTTDAGDIVLYSGDQLVVFYGSNSWAYTRLGKITDKSADEMTDLLANGDVTITITSGQ